MKIKAIALDYDGTIAVNHGIHPEIAIAILEARRAGLVVVLVTGRTYASLSGEVRHLDIFNALVLENGAVVFLPEGKRMLVFGAPPPADFLEALRSRQIPFETGRSVVETDAGQAHAILGIVHRLQLPLTLLFNRGRLMVLPQSISKRSGLERVLAIHRMSPHNTVAVGDAENDFELLQAAELGLAVAWGSEALKRTADGVVEGTDPSAVAAFIRRIISNEPLPGNGKHSRSEIHLGQSNTHPVTLKPQDRLLLISGEPLSGKSWLAGLICEQLLLQQYSLCVIDPEGDYGNLETLPGVTVVPWFEAEHFLEYVEKMLHCSDSSVIFDLSQIGFDQKRLAVPRLLELLTESRRRFGVPHRIVIDEAHYFLTSADSVGLLGFDMSGYTLVTYRTASLHPTILANADAVLVTRQTDPDEVAILAELAGLRGDHEELASVLGTLSVQEAVMLPLSRDAANEARRFEVAGRFTGHVRHRHKYFDLFVPESQAFIFTQRGMPTGVRARSIREFLECLETLPSAAIEPHARAGDFSNWLKFVFHDFELSEKIAEFEAGLRNGRPIKRVKELMAQTVTQRYSIPI